MLSLLRLGSVAEAHEIAVEVAALYERMGRPKIHQVRPLRAVHEVMLSTGDRASALAALELELADEADPHYRVSTHQLMALWHSRIGRTAAAGDVERHVTAGRRDAAAAGCPRCAAEFHLRAAEARRSTGPTRPLERVYRRWIAGLSAPSSDEAAADLRETLSGLVSFGFRLEEYWLRLDLANAILASDRPGAIEQLRSALRIATDSGAPTEARHADQELRRLGARTWRRGAARRAGATTGLSALTSRELEIAQAAAVGDSNPEIADRLFLSRRTVEHHLSTIMRKLEVRNRTELASIDELRGESVTQPTGSIR
jgi:DNA-binding CsgD family transcriptional regulator